MHDFLILSILGLIEGVTEFLPISSSGHLIIARELLGAVSPNALAIDAVLQLGAILAVVVYFFKDLRGLAYTAVYKILGRPVKDEEWQLLVALIIATVPALVLGIFLEKTMETAFRDTRLVAYALIVGSVIFLLAEHFSKRKPVKLGVESLGIMKSLGIGFFQALALVPGMSRSGMTISGGLFFGLSREAAARFGFLLSVPLIGAAGLKKFVELAGTGALSSSIGVPLLVGSAVAFLSGLLAIHVLLWFLRTYPLYVFVVYRVLLAVAILFFFPV